MKYNFLSKLWLYYIVIIFFENWTTFANRKCQGSFYENSLRVPFKENIKRTFVD